MMNFVDAFLIPDKCYGHQFAEHEPILATIGEKYRVVAFCEEENAYVLEVTEENIDWVNYQLNSPSNDIYDFEKIS